MLTLRLAHRLLTIAALCSLGGSLFGSPVSAADSGQLTVHVDNPGVKISPILYGLMTEEINHSYDGGLYGEMVQNRSFKDDPTTPVHWSLVQDEGAIGSIALDKSGPLNGAQDTSLRLDIASVPAGGRAGVANDGYWGMPTRPNELYLVSFYARSSQVFTGPLTVDLESTDGKTVYWTQTIPKLRATWQRYDFTHASAASFQETSDCRLVVSVRSTGSVWLSLVSAFPPTYAGRTNGNRIDLMQKLADMHQSFLRLPGGNYLEGDTIPNRFEWKETIGPLENRPGHQGPWGYRSSDGLGLLEFLEWCEDLKIEPLLAVYAGYSLRGDHVNPGPDLQPYVQDALDEIEYCTGDTSTKWGAVRAKDGHAAPFKIEYVEIGNEDWFDKSGSYDGRYAQFYDAIKAKYPNLKLIATTRVQGRVPDVIDDHYYRSAAQMERDSTHYDKYDRSGPRIFVGEWASTEGSPTPNLRASLGDAAWLTGLERDSDVVVMASYAPLLVNVNPKGRQWGTNLIGYDALHSFGSPSYYVQSIFAANKGDVVLPVEVKPQVVETSANALTTGGIGVGTWRTQSQYKDISVSNGGQPLYQSDFAKTDPKASGLTPEDGDWKVVEGALQQTSPAQNCRATTGDEPSWSDYDLKLKARKISGAEGFLIYFRLHDKGNLVCLNIGGWNNSRTAIQESLDGETFEIGKSPNVTVETGRWYDIEIQVAGNHIRTLLDGALLEEADIQSNQVDPIYSTASRDLATGDVIVKVVNVSGSIQELNVVLDGFKTAPNHAKLTEISGQPNDVNSLSDPRKVAPVSSQIDVGPTFAHAFPPYSVSVLRIPQR